MGAGLCLTFIHANVTASRFLEGAHPLYRLNCQLCCAIVHVAESVATSPHARLR